ncbi:MAG: ABC transporter ATP-binding protein [Nitrososphaerota archaeon]
MEAIGGEELRVENLGCRYERRKDWIFRDLNFSVKPGDAVAVVGPSGSGKTTLAYCLTGIIPNRIKAEVEGRVLVDGKNVLTSRLRDNVKLVNIVLQNYEMQIFGLTVEEDLAFSLENLGLEEHEIEARVKWALEKFRLSSYRSYYVHELSGGLKQRLAIASSIIMAPKYLVMDEPTANLDWNGIVELSKTINALKMDGRGIIIMTRRLKGLENVIDRVISLNGRKVSARTAAKLPEPENIVDPGRSEPVITFEDVWFRYSGERNYVLRGINLKILKGQCVALMGPNGSGKTTLIKHVNGLLKPVKGKVTILGKDTKEYSAAQLSRYVGMVFQDPDKHITCETVWEEATFGARNIGVSENYAEEALKALGLIGRKDDPPYLLSMGEKIRLSMAGAIGMNPEILILDEPTTGQDEETLMTISSMINYLRSVGKTIIIVTHDSDFALSVSDRLVVMKDGAIAADGAPKEILLNWPIVEELGLEPPIDILQVVEVEL